MNPGMIQLYQGALDSGSNLIHQTEGSMDFIHSPYK